MIKRAWKWLWGRPGAFSIGSMLAVGAVGGVLFWGGFNTFMEYTNTLEFCVSCHEMDSTVYQEYKKSAHYSNPSGVRAVCADCHVPKDWTPKLIRKVQASKELYHWAVGTIDTPEKFEAHRLDMAERVWASMKATDSRECRNCHSYGAMDFENQHKNAQKVMRKALNEGRTCIECHRGVAHKLPDLMLSFKGNLAGATVAAGQEIAAGPRGVALVDGEGNDLGKLMPGAPVKVLDSSGDQVRVEIAGWAPKNYQVIITNALGERLSFAQLTDAGRDLRTVLKEDEDLYGEGWQMVTLQGFADKSKLAFGVKTVWELADKIYQSRCGSCHAAHATTAYTTNQWPGELDTMADYGGLMGDELLLVRQYLQANAKSLLRPKKAVAVEEENDDL